MDELSRLNDRAEELNMEIENRPMFGRQRQYVDLNAALQDRVLILELSRLVNDFQRSIKKLQTHEMNNCDNGTSLVYIGVDSLDGDQEIVGELITAQVRALLTCMRIYSHANILKCRSEIHPGPNHSVARIGTPYRKKLRSSIDVRVNLTKKSKTSRQ